MKNQTGLYRTHKLMIAAQPQINYLKVVSYHSKNKHGNVIINCICSCGKKVTKYFSDLNSESAYSCGCYHKAMIASTGRANRQYYIDNEVLNNPRILNYLSGLYAADGTIYENNTSELALHIKDKELLTKIKKVLKFTGEVRSAYDRCRLHIGSEYFKNQK